MGAAVPPDASGFLLVDKPVGPSSHAAVQTVRRTLGYRGRRGTKAGHAGTLDPFASGLLVVLIGRATRLMPFVVGHDKRYLVGVRFGASSDTDDATGRLAVDASIPPNRAAVDAAVARLAASTRQVPPAVSAIHIDGERAYQRVRKGEVVEVPERDVRFESIEVVAWNEPGPTDTGPQVLLDVRCGSGTYMRALARDLGHAVGCAAHCDELRRTEVGEWTLDGALAPDAAATQHIRDAAGLLGDTPRVSIGGLHDLASVINGRPIEVDAAPGHTALMAPDGTLAAVADVDASGRAHPRTVLALSAVAATTE